jgi:hypothetical protein
VLNHSAKKLRDGISFHLHVGRIVSISP